MTGEYMKGDGFYDGLERVGIIPVIVLEKENDATPMPRGERCATHPFYPLSAQHPSVHQHGGRR